MTRPIRPDLAAELDDADTGQQVRPVVVDAPPADVQDDPAGLVVPQAGRDVATVLSAPQTGPDTVWWERAVIGSVLQGYDDVGTLARTVGPADMWEPAHELVWEAVLKLWDAGVRPTVMAVMDQLGAAAQRLPQGPRYLADLLGDQTLHPFQAPMYAEHVRECALKRQIGRLGIHAQQIVADPDATSEQFLAGLGGWLERITAAQQPMATGLSAAFERIIHVAEVGQTLAVATPWPEIDDLLGGGLYPGQLVVVGARPGVGKSVFLENICTHVGRTDGCESLFFSLEMTTDELVTRTLAWTARVPLDRLRVGGDRVDESHWERIAQAQQRICDTRMSIVDASDQTVRTIRMEARRAHMAARRAGRRLAVVCVDYAGLITGTNPRHNAREVLCEVSRELKKMAKELGCTVVLAAQLNREGKDRKHPQPVITDFKESGSLEQDADVAVLLHAVEQEDDKGRMTRTDEVQVLVPKQRNGPTGIRSLQFWGHYQRLAQYGTQVRALAG